MMTMRSKVLAIMTAIGALSLAAACGDDPPANEDQASSTSGSPGAGGQGGGGPSCDWGCGACGACVTTACTGELAQCDADPECAAWSQCLLGCPSGDDGDVDAACAAACPGAQASAGQAAIASVEACRADASHACPDCGEQVTECTSESPLLCQECQPSAETNPCFVCEDEHCCDSYQASKGNPAQPALSACLGTCLTDPDPATCEYECAVAHPDALSTFAPLTACMKVHCAMEQTACDESQRDDCQVCLWETCRDSYAAFTGTPQGYLLQACILHCAINDTACDNVCYDAYPQGKDLFDVWGQCVTMECSC